MLLRRHIVRFKALPLRKIGNARVLVAVVAFFRIVERLLIHRHIAGEGHGIAAGAEYPSAVFKIDRKRCKTCRFHLARHESFPYQLVKLILIGREMRTHCRRQKLDLCGTYRLVRILCGLVRLIVARRSGAIIAAEFFGYERARGGLSLLRDALRVGSHVGDKTLGTAELRAEVYALVELLCGSHRARCLKTELS